MEGSSQGDFLSIVFTSFGYIVKIATNAGGAS